MIGSNHHFLPEKVGNLSLPLSTIFLKIYSHNKKGEETGNYVKRKSTPLSKILSTDEHDRILAAKTSSFQVQIRDDIHGNLHN